MGPLPERPRDPAFDATIGPTSEGRIARSLRLAGASWRLLLRYRSLLALEALSVVTVIGGSAAWVALGAGAYFAGAGDAALLLLLPAFYFVIGTGVFFSVALVAMASAALDGRDPTIREGVEVAWSRLGLVARWTLLAMGVGALIQLIAEKLPPFMDRVAEWLLGAAWGVVTLLVVPVMTHEGGSATGSLRRSARLVRERWGEGIAGSVAIGLWAMVLWVPALALAIPAAGLIEAGALVPGIALAVGAGLLALVGSVIADGLRQVFSAALYRFAITNAAPPGFAREDLAGAMRPRRRLLRRLFRR
jgi:Family of unknown function (DUF6159)